MRPGQRASRSSSSARPISARIRAKTSTAGAIGGLTSRWCRRQDPVATVVSAAGPAANVPSPACDAERMELAIGKADDVEEIDARAASDGVLARFHAVELACHHELHPEEPARSREEAIAFYRHQPTTHASCHWLADGGAASLYVHGPSAALLHVLVEPRRRRRGIGTLLLAEALRRARELEVEALSSSYTTDAGAAFAARFGFVAEGRVVQSVLDLRAAELPRADVPAGFRLLTWLGRVPDEYLTTFVAARAAMDDAPQPDGMDL